MKNILIFLLLIAFFHRAYSQQTILLDNIPEPYYTIEYPEKDNTAPAYLPVFNNKLIVGLGEATHGTREFYTIKSNWIKHLIQFSNYRCLIFESSFGSMLPINEFVKGGPGSIDTLLQKNQYWMFYTPEIKELLLWIRNYNFPKAPQEQVQVFGMDIQASESSLLFLLNTLQKKSPAIRQQADSLFAPLQSLFGSDKKAKETLSKETVLRQISILQNWLNDHTETESPFHQLYALCLANVVQEYNKNKNQPAYRDSCMAENVIALTQLFNHKTILWAHNLHVGMKDSLVNYEFASKPMGEFLRQTFKDQYYPVGFLQNQGGFLALEQKKKKTGFQYPHLRSFSLKKPDPGYLTEALAASGPVSFFPQIDRSASPFWKKYHKIYTAGATHFLKKNNTFYITPRLVFQGLVIVQNGTAARQIDTYFYKTLN